MWDSFLGFSLRPGSVKLSASCSFFLPLCCKRFLKLIQGILFCVYIIAHCTEGVNRFKVFFMYFLLFRPFDENWFILKDTLAAISGHFA